MDLQLRDKTVHAFGVHPPAVAAQQHMNTATAVAAGPFGAAILMLVFAILVAVLVLAVIGAALVWIPVFALALAFGAWLNHRRR
jgi:hypothetical protein